jgi:SNF2 family DNA or RNA helicase
VAPLSTLFNWELEFHRFAPQLKVQIYHGTKPERLELQNNFTKALKDTAPILITSYEMIYHNLSFFKPLKVQYCVVDEGHRLKNHQGRTIRSLQQIHTEHRILLTGTPLQNDLGELWSLVSRISTAETYSSQYFCFIVFLFEVHWENLTLHVATAE